MRLGYVRGTVVLSIALPELKGAKLLIVEPVTTDSLKARTGDGGGKSLVVASHLSPGEGQLIGISEGREAANAWHPKQAPVDAYCALIVDTYDI
jgi:microcompartment protein CcmK/EutM